MRLIDADALEQAAIERYKSGLLTKNEAETVADMALNAPTIDAVPMDDYMDLQNHFVDWEPVRHGKWVPDEADKWRCSECGIGNNYAYKWSVSGGDELQDNYCPNCGARMDGGRDEDSENCTR